MKINVFLIFVWCQMQLVVSSELLSFWDRFSSHDGRRVISGTTLKVIDLRHHIKPKPNKDKVATSTKAETKGSTLKQIEPIISRVYEDPDTGFDRGKNILRNGAGTEQATWPKIQKRMRHNEHSMLRSTRMTPLHLMQQSKEKHETTKTVVMPLAENNLELDFEPTNIREQLEQISRDYAEVANITVEVIGRTIEYKDIVILKMTEKPNTDNKYFRADDKKYMDESPEKKIIFIVHGLSIKGYKDLPCLSKINDFKKLLDMYIEQLEFFDIFLIPMANPDGLSTFRRLWDKNLSPQGACPGVALDRNFDVAWNSSLSTISSCSRQYPGPKAFSEPETKAIREIFHYYGHKIVAYWHVHGGTYDHKTFKGDAVLYPKGYSDQQTDEDKYIDLKAEIEEAMKNASFHIVSVHVDTLYNWYGKVYGTSVDYASTVYGIPYATELVMQIYEEDNDNSNDQSLKSVALTEIWKRVIQVLFSNIWKNTKSNDV